MRKRWQPSNDSLMKRQASQAEIIGVLHQHVSVPKSPASLIVPMPLLPVAELYPPFHKE